MADKLLLEYSRLGLESGAGELLTESGNTFITEGTVSTSDTDAFLLEDGSGVIDLEGSVTITAAIAESQSAQTEAIVGKVFFATIAEAQTAQTESIVAVETYRATLAESQTAQAESIAAHNFSVSLAESQTAQTESIAASEAYILSIIEAQSAQDEAITGTVAGPISAAIVEGQALQTEYITGQNTSKAIPVQKPQQFVGMGGRWYTHRDFFRMMKKKLEEEKVRHPEPAPEPQPVEREPDPVFVASMSRVGTRPRREITFTPLDLSGITETAQKQVTTAKRDVRRRREREAVEV